MPFVLCGFPCGDLNFIKHGVKWWTSNITSGWRFTREIMLQFRTCTSCLCTSLIARDKQGGFGRDQRKVRNSRSALFPNFIKYKSFKTKVCHYQNCLIFLFFLSYYIYRRYYYDHTMFFLWDVTSDFLWR